MNDLLKVLDMSEDEQYLWVKNWQDKNCIKNRAMAFISLADLAFRLRDEVVTNQGEIAWHKAEVIVCEYMGKATCWISHYGQPIHWIIAALKAKEQK